MEFRQLEAFVATAELKSFSKAAKYLYLSQSTVSSHINNLENILGKTLLLRTTKSIALTPEGESFLMYARRIVETKDLAILSLQQSSKRLIHLGASSIPSAYLLPEIIAGFTVKNPDVQFHIHQGGSDSIAELLLNGHIDLAFTGKDINSSYCESFAFCSDRLILITPNAKEYMSKTIGEILQFPIILRSSGSGTQFIANKVLESLGIEKSKLNIIAQTNDLETIKMMVVKGVGISICSEYAIQDLLSTGQVLSYPLSNASVRQFSLHYLNTKNIQPQISSFIEYMKSLVKDR